MKLSPVIRNKTWNELAVGDSARLERACAVQDLILFAHASGVVNPLMPPDAEGTKAVADPIAPRWG